ncbi:MAG: histidinol-phosphate transaminase [Actinobacteria bacterium]|nr:histidinol-phosphate transaminase [Actinomycetota bacterium]
MTVPRFRDALASIPAYRAGKGPSARTDDIEAFKVSSNENPYPPLPRVQRIIADAAAQVNRYPDPSSRELVDAIAAHCGVPREHVSVATGAVALCYQFAHATAGPGDEVIFAWRSFEAYPILTALTGAKAVKVPLTESLHHDLVAMAAAVTKKTRLIFVCSPNNPTGTIVTQQDLDTFLDAVPDDVLVVLDEAYIEFNSDPDGAMGLATYRDRPNLAVLRTFSKAYGLAGLRVGYAIAQPQIVEALAKTALPFGVSVIAQAAAVASLADDVELLERVAALNSARTSLIDALKDVAMMVGDSEANFVWLPLGRDTSAFAQRCEDAGLAVRAFPDEGVRVTIGEPGANARLVEVAAVWVAG